MTVEIELTRGGGTQRTKDDRVAIALSVALSMMLGGCSEARREEPLGSSAAAVTVGSNDQLTYDFGFETPSVAYALEYPPPVCGGSGDAAPPDGGCPHPNVPFIAYQIDSPSARTGAVWNLIGLATRGTAGMSWTSSTWGLPAEAPTRAGGFTAYLSNPVAVANKDRELDVMGIGGTSTDHFASEVFVAHHHAGADAHLLTQALNPAYYPFVAHSGGAQGTLPVPVDDVGAALDSDTGETWAAWVVPRICPPLGQCIEGRTFLTSFHFSGSTFVHGPTWTLTLPAPAGSPPGQVAPFGQMKLAVSSAGYTSSGVYVPLRVFVGWPDTAAPTSCSNPSADIWWHVTTVTPNYLGTQSAPPTVTDQLGLHDPQSPSCLQVKTNPTGSQLNLHRPAFFYDPLGDDLWIGASKRIVVNGHNYGNRIVFNTTRTYTPFQVSDAKYEGCYTRRIVADTTVPAGEDYCEQWSPAAATSSVPQSPPGSIAVLTWREARKNTSSKALVYGASFTPLIPLNWSLFTMSAVTAPGQDIPWSQTAPADAITRSAWGQYDGVAGDPLSGQFYAAWGDNRVDQTAGARLNVWGASVNPPW